MPNSYYMLQLWKKGHSYSFHCKPLPGSKVVDLVGQRRAALCRPNQLYFTTDDTILVNIKSERPLVFNSHGTLIDYKNFDMSKPIKVLQESTQSDTYNKFLILKDSEQKRI